jgi:hypothetical protein
MAQDLGRGIGLPLLVDVPSAPIPVGANGKHLLVYELHLTNPTPKPVTLLRVEGWASSGRVFVLEGEPLAKAIKPSGVASQQPLTVGPGLHAVVLIWLSVDQTPAAIRHTLQGTVAGDPEPLLVEYHSIPVGGEPVRLGAPLRGDRWLAANGPSNDTHHRRSWLSFGGRALVPERFAIDFVRLSDTDSLTNGDPADNRSYVGYGAEAIAVGDARVAAVKDGIPDNVPANQFPSPALAMEDMGGNYVGLDLGGSRYAFYAHLQPGSIRVKPGARVQRGQVLGLLGNSGTSNAPHLHFQVSDRPSLLLSDGLPYVFESFAHEGQSSKGEIPLQNWVVRFP